jgi:DNA (cytosine-5)-methyltransferase 3A
MSCGQQALERVGIKVNKYFASEIDKYAIEVTMANYPNTIQLGSVLDVDGYKLPKIDLLMGGSPCQSFSFAGKRKGMSTKCETEILTLEHYLQLKSEGYEFEGQSYLFWEFMRLLNEVKPKYFLLENVEMGEKWERVLSKAIGINGIHINSALVSAQNRKRIYWTNIGMQPMGLFGYPESIIQQPKDRGILLKDILESQVDEKYFLSKRMINSFKIKTQHFKDNGGGFCFKPSDGNNKGRTLTNPGKNRMDDNFIVHNTMPRSGNPKQGGTGHLSRNDGKPYCLDTGNTNAIEIVAMRGRGEKGNIEQQLETNGTNKSNSLTTVTKDNLVAIMLGRSKEWGAPENDKGKSYTLCKEQPHGIKYNSRIRRLTPIECERLQTVEDNYTSVVSDSQRYKMLGNGWTISVIAHIFSYIK